MRAAIGRARENRSSAELELMSSTSRDVGELWNGESIVRSMGRPSVVQLILIRSEINDSETRGLYTLETALAEGKMSCHGRFKSGCLFQMRCVLSLEYLDYDGPTWSDRPPGQTNKIHSSTSQDASVPSTTEDIPRTSISIKDPEHAIPQELVPGSQRLPEYSNNPNISLNLHHGSGLKALIASAIMGGLLQFGVVAYAGAVTFHPGLRKRVPPYSEAVPHLALLGFVLLSSGTIILTVSLAIVCNIIETSTSEREWTVTDQNQPLPLDKVRSDQLRVMWIQREHSVGDQQFDAAVLLAKRDKSTVLTSRRSERLVERIARDQKNLETAEGQSGILAHIAHDQTEWSTVISSVTSLVGFILQFQGFRYVNWSCSLVQLAAIFAMTLVRAVLRRGLVVRPQAFPVAHPRHELDRLTKHLVSDPGYFGQASQDSAEERDFHESVAWTITFAYHGDLLGELGNDLEQESEKPITGGDSNQDRDDSGIVNHGISELVSPLYQGNVALAIRNRLQTLTRLDGCMEGYAQAVAIAIKSVLNTFIRDGTSFVWILDLPGYYTNTDLDSQSQNPQRIARYRITIDRDCDSIRDWNCEGLALTLESVLSLWLACLKEEHPPGDENTQSASVSPQLSHRFSLGPEIGDVRRGDIVRWIVGANSLTPRVDKPNDSYTLQHEKYHHYDPQRRPMYGIRDIRPYDPAKGIKHTPDTASHDVSHGIITDVYSVQCAHVQCR